MDDPRRPRWISVFIIIFLSIQILLPLRYYLGGSAPDERFCWRMFSTQQLTLETDDYQLRVLERSGNRMQELNLSATISRPWIRFLEYGFPRVIERFLAWRFEREQPEDLVLRLNSSQGTDALVIEYPSSPPSR